jgi:hypothetical protein
MHGHCSDLFLKQEKTYTFRTTQWTRTLLYCTIVFSLTHSLPQPAFCNRPQGLPPCLSHPYCPLERAGRGCHPLPDVGGSSDVLNIDRRLCAKAIRDEIKSEELFDAIPAINQAFFHAKKAHKVYALLEKQFCNRRIFFISLKEQCHEIFRLWFFYQTTPLGTNKHAQKLFQIFSKNH